MGYTSTVTVVIVFVRFSCTFNPVKWPHPGKAEIRVFIPLVIAQIVLAIPGHGNLMHKLQRLRYLISFFIH
jgi:hypothetical protein